MSCKEAGSTRDRLVLESARLFADKGYAGTSIREIARAVGITEASVYHHFRSKQHILMEIINYFGERYKSDIEPAETMEHLKENPTPEGMLDMEAVTIDAGTELPWLALRVILNEHYTNSVVRDYVINDILLKTEDRISLMIRQLVELGVLREDVDSDHWSKAHSSLIYSFAGRSALGLSERYPCENDHTMQELLLLQLDAMFRIYGVASSELPPKNTYKINS